MYEEENPGSFPSSFAKTVAREERWSSCNTFATGYSSRDAGLQSRQKKPDFWWICTLDFPLRKSFLHGPDPIKDVKWKQVFPHAWQLYNVYIYTYFLKKCWQQSEIWGKAVVYIRSESGSDTDWILVHGSESFFSVMFWLKNKGLDQESATQSLIQIISQLIWI